VEEIRMRPSGWLSAFVPALLLSAHAAAGDPEPQVAARPGPGFLHELRLGVMAHDVDGLWSGQHKERGVDYSAEIVLERPLFRLGPGMVRPNLGFDWHNRGDTSKAYGGMVWHWNNDGKVSFELGLGAAVHTGERETRDPSRKQLGSKLLFRIPIELGYEVATRQRVSLFFEHVSNAWLADENEGMDLLGVRWAYKF
jgi:hypothetical protein